MDMGLVELNGHEWRLLHVIVLNAIVMVCAWRFVRKRIESDALGAGLWTVMGWLLVQYLSVATPGLAGMLNAWTITGVAMVMAAGLWVAGGGESANRGIGESERRKPEIRNPKPETSPNDEARRVREKMLAVDYYVAWGVMLFLAGYLGALLFLQYLMPPMGDDGLTYHLPAAARWLRAGRFVWHEVWFLNPAATFNPLLGSVMAAWWMGPMGNDFLAKWVQGPGLILVFLAVVQLCRVLGARVGVAAVVGLAAVLSRPFASQIVVVKDDLYLTGFFLVVVGAMAEGVLKGKCGAWKVGIGLGLMLATKVTALLAVPMLVLGVDALWRVGWRWKQWGIVAGLVGVLAGPWYGYNWWLTGNPLYPADLWVGPVHVLKGLFRMERSLELRTVGGAWRILTGAYFSMKPWMFVGLVAAWAACAGVLWRRVVSEPVMRVVMIGPVVGMAVYLGMSQFPEVRYAYPVFGLLFVACGVLLGVLRGWVGLSVAAGLAAASAATGFAGWEVVVISGIALVIAVIGIGVAWAHGKWPRVVGSVLMAGRIAMGVGIFMAVFVFQNAAIGQYALSSDAVWEMTYGSVAEGWTWVRQKVPGGKTVAYANTCLMYPLFGFQWEHEVVYAPTRRGVKSLLDWPKVREPVAGERIVELVVRPVVAEAEKEVWLENLKASGADYLFVVKEARGLRAVELEFVEGDSRFRKVFENEAAGVWEVRR